MLNTLLGHVHFGSALYSLSFPFYYIIIYFSERIWFLMFILALHKNRILILLIHGCSFGLVCLHLLTLSKPRRTRRCLPCLRRNRSVVCSVAAQCSKGTDFQRLAACSDMLTHLNCAWQNNPGQLIIWLACGMMLYHRQRREKRTSRTFVLPIRFATMKLLSCPWQRIFP